MKQGLVTFEMSGSKPITVETGKMALLANGSVTVTQGETVVLVAVCSGNYREGLNFFPLQVSYREKYSAAGRFPGGFFKREGRPTEGEILTSRMTDRPIRPLFPKGFYNEVQIQALVLSADEQCNPDVLSMIGAATALGLSDLPYQGPHASLRVGRVNGTLIANPTIDEMKNSDLELIYSGLEDKVIMIEGDSDQLSEDEFYQALEFANQEAKKQIVALGDFVGKYGKEKVARELYTVEEDVCQIVNDALVGKLDKPCLINDKEQRLQALNELYSSIEEELKTKLDEQRHDQLREAFDKLVEKNIRRLILEEGCRSDGRNEEQLRQLVAEVGVLPRPHGSALFSRGETQTLVVTTLGSSDDAQTQDGLSGESEKKFYLHYNFPNYSVGETGRIMGPGNREIGHGNLAERSIAKIFPKNCPYTVRCVSEIMGSNGSTSMASICGASLSLMNAGVKIPEHVAGISCGLVTSSNGEYKLITDILGSEDHYGDMDFKIAGTSKGITGFQLDLKIAGITFKQLKESIERNRVARMKILEVMNSCIAQPVETLSPYAPQIHQIKINPDKIGAVIGTGGKVIKGIVDDTGAKVDIEDDGIIKIFANNKENLDKAIAMIEGLTLELQIGQIYQGVIQGIKEFGAFVEIGSETGLLHISEIADHHVDSVEDLYGVGDKVTVKVLDIDNRGRVKLSRKAALEEMED